jgi:outer membrane protein W
MTKTKNISGLALLLTSILSVVTINNAAAVDGTAKKQGSTLLHLNAELEMPKSRNKWGTNNTGLQLPAKPFNVTNSWGASVGVTNFLTDNIAGKVSVGYTSLRLRENKDLARQLGTKAVTRAHAFPVIVTAQFHANDMLSLPFGPYMGAGWHYTFVSNVSKDPERLRNATGPVIQLGINIPVDAKSAINIEVSKRWANHKANFHTANTGKLNSKVHTDPLVVSAGVSFNL